MFLSTLQSKLFIDNNPNHTREKYPHPFAHNTVDIRKQLGDICIQMAVMLYGIPVYKNYPLSCKPITLKTINKLGDMILIDYKGTNETIREAVIYTNNLFSYDAFINMIGSNKKFDMANTSPQKIASMIRNTDLYLSVDLYLPLPFAKDAYAYDDPLNPTMIHMNKRTLNRPVHSLCNTMVHQCVHAINAANPGCYFGHGDNNPDGKDNTAPFWIAGLAQKLIAQDDIALDTMTHEDIKNIPVIEKTTTKDIQESLFNEGIFCFYDMKAIMEA